MNNDGIFKDSDFSVIPEGSDPAGKKRAKKSKKGHKPIVVSKESLLYQPWKLIRSGYDATAFQQNVIISVLRKLKSSLSVMRDEYTESRGVRQLSLFETENAMVYREEEDSMVFDIHMKELGVEPQNYQRAFNAVCNIGDIDVWVPVKNKEGEEDELERAKLFSIIVRKEDVILDEANQVIGYKYEKQNPRVKLKLRKNVAETLFQGQIHTFLEETAMNISEKFPKRLYMYFANYKNAGTLTIGYWKFRQQIGFDDSTTDKIQYPKFYDFKKRVLDPSVNKLKEMAEDGMAEYWFEYEPIYKGSAKGKSPDLIKFTIHLSKIGEDFEQQKESYKERKILETILINNLDQTVSQVRKLMTMLNNNDIEQFSNKVNELKVYCEANVGKIRDKRSYVNRTLTDYLIESRQSVVALKKEDDVENVEEMKEIVEESKETTSGFTLEDQKLFDSFIASLNDKLMISLLTDGVIFSYSGNGIVMEVKTKSTFDTFHEQLLGLCADLEDYMEKKVNIRICRE